MLFHLWSHNNIRMLLKYWRKFKYWIIFSVLGVGIVLAAGQVNPSISDITLEKMQIVYDNAPQIKVKYKMKQASFIQEAIDENAIQIEIGDKTKDKFSEELNIRKWDNEVSLKIKHKNKEKKSLELDGNKIKLKGDKTETHFYEVENGYEYEIILLEKPLSNVIEFDIETAGLNFYYQPALTIKDNPEADYCTDTTCFKEIDGQIATTTHRPENVVNSYAVYHKSKTGHIIYPIDKSEYTQEELNEMVESGKYEGKINDTTKEVSYFRKGKNYMAGVAFYIYRPKIIDSAGTEVWGELNIDVEKKLLTVEIPQEFLDKAVYPVRHAAGLEFGYHTQGSSYYKVEGYYRIQGFPFTLSEEGTVTKLGAYFSSDSVINRSSLVVYDNSSPSVRKDYSTPEQTGSIAVGWHEFDAVVGETLTAGTYYLSYCLQAYNRIYIYFNDGSPTHDAQQTITYSYPPHSIFTKTINATYRKYSIYCTYTAGGAEDTCTYSSGDWNVLESDNCYITSDVYVNGKFNLIGSSTGQFGCAPGIKVSAENFNFGTDKTTFDMKCFAHH